MDDSDICGQPRQIKLSYISKLVEACGHLWTVESMFVSPSHGGNRGSNPRGDAKHQNPGLGSTPTMGALRPVHHNPTCGKWPHRTMTRNR